MRRAQKLTDSQERFIQELIKGKSQREAYRIAYPHSKAKDKTVDEKASRLFRDDKIQARYHEIRDRLVQEAEDECIVTVKDILTELKNIAFADGTDYAEIVKHDNIVDVSFKPTSEIPKDKRKAISGIRKTQSGIEIKTHDKLKALELLGKHLGLFDDKDSADTSITIVSDIPRPDDGGRDEDGD